MQYLLELWFTIQHISFPFEEIFLSLFIENVSFAQPAIPTDVLFSRQESAVG